MVAIDGMEIGRKILNNVLKWFAPSISAASSSSFGMPRKKFSIKMTRNVFTAPGSTSTQKESINPIFWITI
ncbi:hypothetical protein D3C73_1452770 [compost metagenome]